MRIEERVPIVNFQPLGQLFLASIERKDDQLTLLVKDSKYVECTNPDTGEQVSMQQRGQLTVDLSPQGIKNLLDACAKSKTHFSGFDLSTNGWHQEAAGKFPAGIWWRYCGHNIATPPMIVGQLEGLLSQKKR